MRTRLGLAVAASLVLVGCGTTEDSSDDRAAELEAKQAESEAAAAERAARNLEAKQAEFDRCARAIRPLADALAEVDSRLSVGLSNDQYGQQLGDVQIAYDRLTGGSALKRVARPCINQVAIPLENALNGYLDVLNDWSNCIQDYACDFNAGQINEDTQATWLKSSEQIASSKRALTQLRP